MHRPYDHDVRPHPLHEPSHGWRSDAGPDPAQVDPAVLGALLARHGWQRRGGAVGRYARWTPPGATHGSTSLLVPENRSFPDCEDLLAEALLALTRSADPSAHDVLLGLTVPSDEIRWWRDVHQGPSGASWIAQEQLRSAARQMMMAGALAARGRAGYHGARHRRGARTSLADVLVGPASGGAALTAFVPVTQGRAVTVRLHLALQAAREATDYQRATGGMEAFDAAVRLGVSRELTESLIALVRGSEGARIALAWSPAAGVPEGCVPGHDPVEFSPGDLPALRAAGARYLQDEPAMPVRLTGTVVRMRRPGPRGSGTVRLRVLAGAEVPHVRVALEEDSYRTAGQAHLTGQPIRVAGRLESRGGFRRLTDASDVVAVPVDDAERDRLMKALKESREDRDFLPGGCDAED
ncbi:hypothetical protein [Streptomyces albipurpureus]|uniref:Uncharacterized protein n=1 Tax=Streptomyces albipurpureus TaxID=2897419 RepID=A0ABT0UWL7_9ACTN|nr:hypothetical protein [Streptomyces sp. CWNU-1]MCM2392850.1 hypothetical protein [Streptomyces sp. CWNU-1]